MNKSKITLIVIGILVVLFLILGPFFILNEGEIALRIRFGKVLESYSEAGLKFKMPVIDNIRKYPKKIQSWDGAPQRIPTQENQFIFIDTSARWKISDPKTFYESIGELRDAQQRLDQVIESSVYQIISTHSIREAVRNSNIINTIERKNVFATSENNQTDEDKDLISSTFTLKSYPKITTGRENLAEKMLTIAKEITPKYGIELIDVIIRQIKYSDDLTQSVYNRMIKERNQIAQAFRSDGQGQKATWLGKMEKELRTIRSTAEKTAKELRAKADAEALKIRNEAYTKDPEFAEFWMAVQQYEKLLPKMKKILTTDFEFFKYLYKKGGR